jgi:Acetone carboxylase, gamma subunit
MKRQMTEYLDIDLASEMWCCHVCGEQLISAREPYKHGCLVAERDPREVHNPHIEGEFTFAPDPEWCRLIEFYCPGCGTMVETEYLPPGHPITNDIELDIDAMKAKYLAGDPSGDAGGASGGGSGGGSGTTGEGGVR